MLVFFSLFSFPSHLWLFFYYNSAHVRLSDGKITHISSFFLEAAKQFFPSFSIEIVVKINIFFLFMLYFGWILGGPPKIAKWILLVYFRMA